MTGEPGSSLADLQEASRAAADAAVRAAMRSIPQRRSGVVTGFDAGSQAATVLLDIDTESAFLAPGEEPADTPCENLTGQQLLAGQRVIVEHSTRQSFVIGLRKPLLGFLATARASRITTAQQIAHNAETAILFNANVYDAAGMHSTAVNTERFVVPAGHAGVYHMGVGIRLTANVNGRRLLALYKVSLAGAVTTRLVQHQVTPKGTSSDPFTTSTDIDAVAGDYFYATVFHDAGVGVLLDLTILANDLVPGMWVHQVSWA